MQLLTIITAIIHPTWKPPRKSPVENLKNRCCKTQQQGLSQNYESLRRNDHLPTWCHDTSGYLAPSEICARICTLVDYVPKLLLFIFYKLLSLLKLTGGWHTACKRVDNKFKASLRVSTRRRLQTDHIAMARTQRETAINPNTVN